MEKSNCDDCELKGFLHLHPYFKHSLYFAISFSLILIPAILRLVFGFGGISILIFSIWFGFEVFFFYVWESKVMCSHCPHYSNTSQKMLHCRINSGMYTITKYNPSPMSELEKAQFIMGAIILVAYPLPFLTISNQIAFFILTCCGIAIWITTIQLKHFRECIYFLCPLNRVSEDLKGQFFEKNPQLKEVWKTQRNEV
ncbi:MAG: hypothetical protein P8Y23_05070 [Candidatus Lokiarchaeota archaeon]